MMAGLLSLLRLDPMFSIYQKIASGAPKTAPATSPGARYDWLIATLAVLLLALPG